MNTLAQNPSVHVVPFIAESAADAVAQIRAKLGPDAVVVNVRQLPADGLAKLWKNPRIEVLAYKPDPETRNAEPGTRSPDPLSELKQELQAIRQQLASANVAAVTSSSRSSSQTGRPGGSARSAGVPTWRVGEVLETSGLMPLHAQRVMEQLQSSHGEIPPASLAEEMVMARKALSGFWRNIAESPEQGHLPHVFVGPAAAGKTTCICKWLAQARLVEGRSAHVWRLDAATANTAEALSVYCEILGVPSERTWSGAEKPGADLNFIDLPGIDWRNSGALHNVKQMLEAFGPCRVHLVLNAAYEVPLLLAQARAFSLLPIDDLILTHLDEEPRWGKIWNIVLGTNYPVRFLSAAQNVPGEFLAATPERILMRQFPV
jgi:flagellar biosynthesis protein FlhF